MPTPQQLRNRLLKKLKELFQLDQPDLDFGFYRIMHAKSVQVQEFIEKDLLKIVADAFGQVDEARSAGFRAEYEKAIETAKEFGAPEPEKVPRVQEAKAKWESCKDTATSEGDIYDHLYRFFERYYDGGDFMSRRYYARETSGKAAPYAIPYNGEEVKLHWANADQYYIKTAEYFSNFTFDLTQAAEFRAMSDEQRFLQQIPDHPVKVHFRIADATEGEHGNVKASETNKRFFIVHGEKPVDVTDEGVLVIYFEYRPDPEKTGQDNTWREKRNAEAVESVLKALEGNQQITKAKLDEYLRLLTFPAPTDKDKNRPLLAKYINQYTARNTMDYFIHKDLGGFLRRELDFYIKNEVMRLDDIENADAPLVDAWLTKVKVLRKIAGKLIDFLAQLEDFQKKLWLKKRFVVETNYCITLDRIPEALYPGIAANEAQHDEWLRLFVIDEIEADTFGNPGYVKPLTVQFLKANDKLVLDTRFFDEGFKASLVASIENFDEQCDGLLIHSENFQALNLLQERYREQVKCVYIDPPYNTGGDGFAYKDSYQHSSWLAMVYDRIRSCLPIQALDGSIFCSIDEREMSSLVNLMDNIYSEQNRISQLIWQKKFSPQNDEDKVTLVHEYLLSYSKLPNWTSLRLPRSQEQMENGFSNSDNDPRGPWSSGDMTSKTKAAGHSYPVNLPSGGVALPPAGRQWAPSKSTFDKLLLDNRIWFGKDGANVPRIKQFLSEAKGIVPVSLLFRNDVGDTQEATRELKNYSGMVDFESPKPTRLIMRIMQISANKRSTMLDYFAGSGTTGHAVINLNRGDNGERKYVLVEMADYFDTVLKPRIAKVIYSDKWKDGKPNARQTGISHCFKYIRLESYEDTLNNLHFDEDNIRDKAVNSDPALKEDYMLHYLLDVETRGSQSLLNIDAFADPTAYTLKVKKPGSDEYTVHPVDLLETFNYLLGLRVIHTAEPQTFTSVFKRVEDPEAPEGQKTKLSIDGKLQQAGNETPATDNPVWWFRKVEGWVPGDPANPNNGKRENVLIVWRNLTGDLERDNAVLDEWFRKNRISPRDYEFDTIYVSGSNNLPNLRLDTENWKVRLIEEAFMKRMWDVEGL